MAFVPAGKENDLDADAGVDNLLFKGNAAPVSNLLRTPLLDVKNKPKAVGKSSSFHKNYASVKDDNHRLEALNLQALETPKRNSVSRSRRSCFAAFQIPFDAHVGTTLPGVVEDEPEFVPAPEFGTIINSTQNSQQKSLNTDGTSSQNSKEAEHILVSEDQLSVDKSTSGAHEDKHSLLQHDSRCNSKDGIEVTDNKLDKSQVGSPCLQSDDVATDTNCEEAEFFNASSIDVGNHVTILDDNPKEEESGIQCSPLISVVEEETNRFVEMLVEEIAADVSNVSVSSSSTRDRSELGSTSSQELLEHAYSAEPLSTLMENDVSQSQSPQAVFSSTPRLQTSSVHVPTETSPDMENLSSSPNLSSVIQSLESPVNESLPQAELSALMEAYLLNTDMQNLQNLSLSSPSVQRMFELELFSPTNDRSPPEQEKNKVQWNECRKTEDHLGRSDSLVGCTSTEEKCHQTDCGVQETGCSETGVVESDQSFTFCESVAVIPKSPLICLNQSKSTCSDENDNGEVDTRDEVPVKVLTTDQESAVETNSEIDEQQEINTADLSAACVQTISISQAPDRSSNTSVLDSPEVESVCLKDPASSGEKESEVKDKQAGTVPSDPSSRGFPTEITDCSTNTSMVSTADISVITDHQGIDRCQVKSADVAVDVSLMTDQVPINDISMMAVPDWSNKQTMTEKHEMVDCGSAMTPLKLGKQGHRLTAEEVRRQHPRTVANELESVMAANQRLQKEVKSTAQMRDKLSSKLKETKAQLVAAEKQLAEEKAGRQKDVAMLEQLQQEATSGFESCLQEKQSRICALEENLEKNRIERKTAEEKYESEVNALRKKLEQSESLRLEAELQFAQEIQKMRVEFDDCSYVHEFATAQQVIQELQAEKEEFAGLMEEIEHTAELQEHLKDELQKLASKAQTSAGHHSRIQRKLIAECESLNAELQHAQDQLILFLQDAEEAAQVRVDLEKTQEVLMNQLAEQQDSETIAFEALEKLETELSDMKILCEEAESQLEAERQRCAALEAKQEKMKEEYESSHAKLYQLVENLEHTLESWEQDRDIQDQELQDLRLVVTTQNSRMATLTQQLSSFQEVKAQCEASAERVKELQTTNQFLEAEKQLYLETLTDCRQKLEAEQYSSQSRQCLADALQANNSELQASLAHCQEELSVKNNLLSALDMEHGRAWEAMETLERKMEDALEVLENVAHGAKDNSVLKKGFGSASKLMSAKKVKKPATHPSMVSEILKRANSGNASLPLLSPALKAGISKSEVKARTAFSSSKKHTFPKQDNFEYGSAHKSTRSGSIRKCLSFSLPAEEQSLHLQKSCRSEADQLDRSASHSPAGCARDTTASPSISRFAQIRSIPPTMDRTLESFVKVASENEESPSFSDLSRFRNSSLSEKVCNVDRLVDNLLKVSQVCQLASDLTIKDLCADIDMMEEELKTEVARKERYKSEVEKKTVEQLQARSQVEELNSRISEMWTSILGFQDQSLQVERLEEECSDLKQQLRDVKGQRQLLSEELSDVIGKMDAGASGKRCDGACLREIIELKKQNQDQLLKLYGEREKHQQLGSKAMKRMKVLEDNWKKAETEVYKFDGLVETIRKTCIKHQSMQPDPALLHIMRLIDGRQDLIREDAHRLNFNSNTHSQRKDRH